MRGLLSVALFGTLALAGCGGGSRYPAVPIAVSVSPSTGRSLNQGGSLNITATVPSDFSGQGVTWSVTGDGVLSNQTVSSVTYTAPGSVTANTNVVVTATSMASPSSSNYVPITVLPFGTFANVQPVNVDGGPVPGQVYRNGGFTSVTICVPGTTNCQTVDGVLVDTSSSGLRILASAMPALPALTDSNGNTVNECVQYPDQSYLWGNVAVADVRIGGEVAGSISIQAIADPANFAIPSACSSSGAGTDQDTQQALGANGILGVGFEPRDCGAACDPSAGGTPPGPAYYACSSSTCSPAFVTLVQQVTHPAVLFATDNNGVALQFAPASGAAPAITGSITFGIGTQTNNALGNAVVFPVDSNGNFMTELPSTGQSLTSSFIDSGSNGLFFPDDDLPTCPSPTSSFFCPASLTPFTATIVGTKNTQNTVNFSVDNADNLFNGSPDSAALSTLAGPNGSGGCTGGSGACSFDWGLPFFYGRNVFIAINGRTPPPSAPAAPWWAYTTGFTKQ